MYDILRLYGGLRIRCLWRMIRELKLAAVPALLLLMYLLLCPIVQNLDVGFVGQVLVVGATGHD